MQNLTYCFLIYGIIFVNLLKLNKMCYVKFVRVTWRDISTVSTNWTNKVDVLQEAQKSFDTERYTVGQIIHETKDFIVLASTVSEDEMYHDVSMIMRSVIVRIQNLKTTTTRRK